MKNILNKNRIIVLPIIILFAVGLCFALKAQAAQNEISNIDLLDTNSNGQIDRIQISVDNSKATTTVIHDNTGWTVTDGGNPFAIDSVSLQSTDTANPIIINVDLNESDAALMVDTSGLNLEVAYTQQASGTGTEIGVDTGTQMAAIVTGDADGVANTENDKAAPVFLNASTTSNTNIRLVFSESLALGTVAWGAADDWTASGIVSTAAAINGAAVDLTVNALGNTAFTANDFSFATTSSLIKDAAGNAVAAFNGKAIADGQAPTLDITDNKTGVATIASGTIIYTFTFSEAVTGFASGDIIVVGGTKGAFAQASSTVFTLVVTPLSNSTANIMVDVPGAVAIDASSIPNVAAAQSVQAVNTLALVLSTYAPVPATSNDTTPNFSFNSSEAGTINYGGDCSSAAVNAISGVNTITFNVLSQGAHSNCTIIVTDAIGNTSNQLVVNPFNILIPSSSGGGGGGGNTATVIQTPVTVPTTVPETVTPEAIVEPVTIVPEKALTPREAQMVLVADDGKKVFESGTNFEAILTYVSKSEDVATESASMDRYTKPMMANIKGLDVYQTYAINNFIVYGTKSTKILGMGERAGVVNSFKSAFGRLPTSETDWIDCIAIGNGRWPSQKSVAAENRVRATFVKIYRKEANLKNSNDNAAISVMAYGLRTSKRNTKSEAAAIKSFTSIFKHSPKTAAEWDAVRAIAYSGAKR